LFSWIWVAFLKVQCFKIESASKLNHFFWYIQRNFGEYSITYVFKPCPVSTKNYIRCSSYIHKILVQFCEKKENGLDSQIWTLHHTLNTLIH
jgi:hypothetical protein